MRIYREQSKKVNEPTIRLICMLDEIVLAEYLAQPKQIVAGLVRLADYLVHLKHYEVSLRVLEVALTHALGHGFVDLELTIYDKLGITLYYLERLEESILYHGYFSTGQSKALPDSKMPAPQTKLPFTDRFY